MNPKTNPIMTSHLKKKRPHKLHRWKIINNLHFSHTQKNLTVIKLLHYFHMAYLSGPELSCMSGNSFFSISKNVRTRPIFPLKALGTFMHIIRYDEDLQTSSYPHQMFCVLFPSAMFQITSELLQSALCIQFKKTLGWKYFAYTHKEIIKLLEYKIIKCINYNLDHKYLNHMYYLQMCIFIYRSFQPK